jgi:hypothetical protein
MGADRCRHDLLPGQCADCAPVPPGLTPHVVRTAGGSVFHRTERCPALRGGQRFADRKGLQVHPAQTIPLDVAREAGLGACEVCFPYYRPTPGA